MSAIVLEDYFKPVFKNLSDRASGYIMRGTVLFLGIVSVGLVYVVQHLGSVLQLSMSVPSTFSGSVFGVFFIGMFFPWIGKRAAFLGAMMASSIMIYIVLRAQLDMMNGSLHFETKPTSVEGCSYNFTAADTPKPVEETVSQFHHISYLYYMPMGAILTCVFAFLLSFLFGFDDPNLVDPRLLAPVMRKYFDSGVKQSFRQEADGNQEQVVQFEMKNNQIE
jgi:solute carrier family 5 (sodium-coupled monocarboxylate transporter), member 8/12